MNKHCKTLAAMAVAFAAVGAAAANFPTGTHLVKGTIKDWRGKVLTSSAQVTIQAVNTNGSVIASTTVTDPTPDGFNFLLQIPLSSTATDSTAAFDDRLNGVVVQDSGLSLAAQQIQVGDANTVSTITLAFVDMQSFTSKDGETVGVPREYIDAIAAWMEAYGYEGDYDPFADYDEDGVRNYDEYGAGTNPFDKSDLLAISDYDAPQGAPHAISFEYVGGHVYGVGTTFSLVNPEWATQPVMKTESDVEHEQVMPSEDEDAVGVATIYVVPAEGASSQFFRVEAK